MHRDDRDTTGTANREQDAHIIISRKAEMIKSTSVRIILAS